MNTQESQGAEQSHESNPFSDSVEIERFFSGGGRQDSLDELLQTLTGSIPIVTLTGDEGSGKTMMCRMIEQAMPADYVTVYFPRTVDSFEDVVRVIARRLEVDPAAAAGDIPGLMRDIATLLRERSKRLLIIFDEAERIYLATLERVRKMLDQMNSSGPLLQIVLCGRSGLHNNFKNLALCNFLEAEERHITLEPLNLEETCSYLSHALRHAGHDDIASVMSRKAMEKIFLASGGNFRQINTQAEAVLQSPGADTEIPPLAGNVREVKKKPRPRRRLKAPQIKNVSINKRKFAWGAGIACAALVVLLFLRPTEKTDREAVEESTAAKNTVAISQPELIDRYTEEKPTPGAQGENESEVQKAVMPQEDVPQAGLPEKEKAPEKDLPVQAPAAVREQSGAQTQQVTSAAEEPEKPIAQTETAKPVEPEKEIVAAPTESEKAVEAEKQESSAPVELINQSALEKEKAAVPIVAKPLAGQETQTPQPEAVQSELPQAAQPVEPQKKEDVPASMPVQIVEAVAEKKVPPAPVQAISAREIVKYHERMLEEIEAEPAEEPARRIEPEKIKVAVIKLDKPTKIIPELQQEPPVKTIPAAPAVEEAEVRKPARTAPAVVKEQSAPKKNGGGDKALSRRIAAGTPWLLGLKDDRYTVQLMVITDSDDEKNLKKMLEQDGLEGQTDKIYILRKESSPDVKYVFYGEYPTMTDARNARNTLPKALRGTKPYAVSVKGAVQKVQAED